MAQHAFPVSDADAARDDHDASSVDAMLVARALRGDTEAFATLFDRHASRIYALAYRIVGHKIEAEDITQDAFLHALNALPTLRRGDAFGPWVTRIATNLAWAALRQRGRLPRAELSEAVTETYPDTTRWGSPEAMNVAAEDQRDVRLTLDRLAPSHRAALAMREIGGLSYADIASSLGTTAGGVEVLLFRARARFRDEYRKVALGAQALPIMTCKQTPHVLAALADHEGDEEGRAQAATHVRRCNACAAALKAQKISRKLLLGLPLTVPAAVRAALLSKAGPTLVSYTRGAAAGAAVGAAGAAAAGVVAGGGAGLGMAGPAVAAAAGGATAGAAPSLPLLTTLGAGGLAGGLATKIVAVTMIGAVLAGVVAIRHTPPQPRYVAHTTHTTHTTHMTRNRGVGARSGGTLPVTSVQPRVVKPLRAHAAHTLAWRVVTPRLLFASVAAAPKIFVARNPHTGYANTNKIHARRVAITTAPRWAGAPHNARGGVGGHVVIALPVSVGRLPIRALAPAPSAATPTSTASAAHPPLMARRAPLRRSAVAHTPRVIAGRRIHHTKPIAPVASAVSIGAGATPVPATATAMPSTAATRMATTARLATPITPSPTVAVERATKPTVTPTADTAIGLVSSSTSPTVSRQRPASRRGQRLGYARRAIASATAPALPPDATATAPALPAPALPPAATATAPALPTIVARARPVAPTPTRAPVALTPTRTPVAPTATRTPVAPTATRAPVAPTATRAPVTTTLRHAASTARSGAISHKAIAIVPSPTVLHRVLRTLPTVTRVSVPALPTVAATPAALPTIIPNGANQHLSAAPTVPPAAVATTRAVVAVPTALSTLIPNPTALSTLIPNSTALSTLIPIPTAMTGQPVAVLTATPANPSVVPPMGITVVPTLAPLTPPTVAPLPSTPPLPTVQALPTTPPLPTVQALPTTTLIGTPTIPALPTVPPAAVPTVAAPPAAVPNAIPTSVPVGVVTVTPSAVPVVAAVIAPTPTAISTAVLPRSAPLSNVLATPTAIPATVVAAPTALPVGIP